MEGKGEAAARVRVQAVGEARLHARCLVLTLPIAKARGFFLHPPGLTLSHR